MSEAALFSETILSEPTLYDLTSSTWLAALSEFLLVVTANVALMPRLHARVVLEYWSPRPVIRKWEASGAERLPLFRARERSTLSHLG
jgi:hypothetical protein